MYAGIAQLVERVICNLQVVGSNPASGSNFFYMKSNIQKIWDYIIALNAIFHSEEERIYTCESDWLYSVAINVVIPGGVETRTTKELEIIEDIICTDNKGEKHLITDFTANEISDILLMLEESYKEATKE